MTRAEKRKANRERWRRFYQEHAAATEAERRAAREERRAANRAAFAERAEERLERDRELGLVHTCARCGKLLHVRGRGNSGFVRLGGKAFCTSCAERRFVRKTDWNAPMDPRAIE